MTTTPHPYPTYKPSADEWLGDVPEHWEVRRIKTLFQESDERTGQRQTELLSLTRTKGLIPQSENPTQTLLAEDLSRYKICRPTDIVMNRMQAWSGMFAVPKQEGLVSPDYCVFGPVTRCVVGYFEHLFKLPEMVGQFAQRSKGVGSGFNRLYTDDFGSIRTIAPPLPEAGRHRPLSRPRGLAHPPLRHGQAEAHCAAGGGEAGPSSTGPSPAASTPTSASNPPASSGSATCRRIGLYAL